MSIWDKTSKFPQNLSREAKREVIVTDRGFVRRQKYTDKHSNARVKDEILVNLEGLANTVNFGTPNIVDIWYAQSTAANNSVVTFFVSYDEPIAYANSTIGALKLDVANTVAGVGGLVATSNTTIRGADNIIEFTFTPTAAGTYAIQAQTAANATATPVTSLKSLNTGNEAVSLVLSSGTAALAGTVVVS